MKVKILRESGRPVRVEDVYDFEDEYKLEYDKIIDELGLKPEDLPEFEKRLKELDVSLADKYDTISEVDLPKSSLGWRRLSDKYQSQIIVGVHAVTNEVFLTLKDLAF